MTAAAMPTGHDMVHLVDQWAGYVAARVPAGDAEDVLQTARETVLSHAALYNGALGEPGGWVFGIVRVTVKAARRRWAVHSARIVTGDDVCATLPADECGAGDPLAFLVTHRDEISWVPLVAAAATPLEWQVVVAFTQTEGDSTDVAALLGTRPSTVRAARGRVAALTRTARTAMAARDEGAPVTVERCIATDEACAALLPYRFADEATAAAALGIARSTFRTRRALLHRLEQLVQQVAATGHGR